MQGKPSDKPEKQRKSWPIIGLVAVLSLMLASAIAVFSIHNDSPQASVTNNRSADGFDFTGFDSIPTPVDIAMTSPPIDGEYLRHIPYAHANGTAIWLVERKSAGDPAYGALISWLKDDPTEHGAYDQEHVCAEFATQLYNNAERDDIKAHIVVVDFKDGGIAHMIVAFNTTDKGLIYVDDTGITAAQNAAGVPDLDRIVDLVPGQPYRTHFIPPFNSSMQDTLNLGVIQDVRFIT